MYQASIRPSIEKLDAYVPGLSIDEIRQKYGLNQVIKMASNENPLGMSPLALEAIARHAQEAFRYPRGGNPRLVCKLAKLHNVDRKQIIVGNGSDEIIDLLLRIVATPTQDNIVCFDPCFNLYPIQASISDLQIKRCKLNPDFSFDFATLYDLIDANTRAVFLTTPDNPSGFCPEQSVVLQFVQRVSTFEHCLVIIDEAYMDFNDFEDTASLLKLSTLPDNVCILRTFSKSYGLAGLRIGYGIVPSKIADAFWRARLPFSVNLLAEEAALAALDDLAFREQTLNCVRKGRLYLTTQLQELGCIVTPSAANYILFTLPAPHSAYDLYSYLLQNGIIIRHLKSYNLPNYLRVTIGNKFENQQFMSKVADFLRGNA